MSPTPLAEPKPASAGDHAGLRDAVLANLDECAEIVRRVSDRAYTSPSSVLVGGTIGKHVRHALDHFRAAAHAGDPGAAPIDYDHRARNVPVEDDRSLALSAIGEVRATIAALPDAELTRAVRVRVMLSGHGAEAVLGSTLARELFFAMHHAIHHHAMIRAIAQEFGVNTSSDFGKAPSTVHHERTAGAR